MFQLFIQPCNETTAIGKFKWVAIILMVAVAFCLTGCGTQTVYVKATEYSYTPVPKRLVKKCPVSAPPESFKYMAMSYDEKEAALVKYAQTLIADVDKCNAQVDEIAKFDTNQQQLVKEQNNAKKDR